MLRRKRFHKVNDFYLDFPSCIVSLVRFSIKIDVLILAFTESLCLVLLRQPETSLILWLYGSGSFWQIHKCSRTWGRLSSTSTNLESVRCKSNEILEVNIQHMLSYSFQFWHSFGTVLVGLYCHE